MTDTKLTDERVREMLSTARYRTGLSRSSGLDGGENLDNERAYLELLALRESSRWIPVSERLPEVGACVLIYVPDGVGATIDVLHTDGKWLDWSSPNKVTHWRPLPEAPIKEVE